MKVFLGGTVNKSQWRNVLVEKLKVEYFNPVTDNWNDKAVQQELYERTHCDYCLYVLTPKIDGYYSIAEVTDDSFKRPERTLFCYLKRDEDSEFNENQLSSLNKVGERVRRNGGRWFDSLEEVLDFFNSGTAEKSLTTTTSKDFTDLLILEDSGKSDIVEPLEAHFLGIGYKVKAADKESEENLSDTILNACQVIVVVSAGSSNSWLSAVAEQIILQRKKFIALFTESERPGRLPDIFQAGMEFTDKKSDAIFNWLITQVGDHHEEAKRHTQILRKALSWDQKGRHKKDLLVGIERREAEQWLKHAKDDAGPLSPTDLQCKLICISKESAENELTDVFLYYGTEDRKQAEEVCRKLNRKGVTTKSVYPAKAGEDHETMGRTYLERSIHCLFFITKETWQDPLRISLVEYASHLNKPVIFIFLEEIEEAFQTARRNSIPFLRTKELFSFSGQPEALMSLLKEDFPYKTTHRNILIKASEWEQSGNDPQNLLKGFDQEQAQRWLEKSSHHMYLPIPLMEQYIRQSQTDQISIFISYARNPSLKMAARLHDKLIALNYNVWFDKNDIPLGVDFQEQINIGIEKAHYFIFVLSPGSVHSPYCKIEVDLAKKYGKRIVPLLHHSLDNTDVIDEEIRRINWSNFVGTEESEELLDASILQLREVLESGKDLTIRHSNILNKALDWRRNHQEEPYLLQGKELQMALQWLQKATDQRSILVKPSLLHLTYINQSKIYQEELTSDVFLFCDEKDRANSWVIKTYYYLLSKGLSVIWLEEEEYLQRNTGGYNSLAGASKVLFFASRHSLQSTRCKQLLQQAADFKKSVITILNEDINGESSLINTPFSTTISLSASRNQDEDICEYLLRLLLADISYHSQHKYLLKKALQWERKKTNKAYLLREQELEYFKTWHTTATKKDLYSPTPLQEEFLNACMEEAAPISEIFISFHPDDLLFARKLQEQLSEFEKITWCYQTYLKDKESEQTIVQAIEGADNFLLILSNNYLSSPQLQKELTAAQKKNKRIIPLVYEALKKDKPDDLKEIASVESYIKENFTNKNENYQQVPDDRFNTIRFSKDFKEDFQLAFNELLKILTTDQVYIQSHNDWLRKAIDWEKGNKKEDRLLKGVDFELANVWLSHALEEKKSPSPTPLHIELIEESKQVILRQKRRKKMLDRVLMGLVIGLLFSLILTGFFYADANLAKKKAEKLAKSEHFAKEQAIKAKEDSDQAKEQAVRAQELAEESEKSALNNERKAKEAQKATEIALSNEKTAKQEAMDSKRSAEHERDIAQRLFLISESGRLSKEVINSDFHYKDEAWYEQAGNALTAFFINLKAKGTTQVKDNFLAMYHLLRQNSKVKNNTSFKEKGFISDVDFSPEADQFLALQEQKLSLWRYDLTGEKILEQTNIKLEGRIETGEFSSDGKVIIAGTQNGALYMASTNGNFDPFVIATFAGHPIVAVASASKDENYWVACKTSDMVYIYIVSLNKNSKIHLADNFPLKNNYRHTLAFAKNTSGPLLFAGGYSEKEGHCILTYALAQHQIRGIIKVRNWVTSLAINASLVASGHEDGSVYIRNLSDHKVIHEFQEGSRFIRQLNFYNNRLMSCAQDKIVIIPCEKKFKENGEEIITLEDASMTSIKGGIYTGRHVFTIEGQNQVVKRLVEPHFLALELCENGVKPIVMSSSAELSKVLKSLPMNCNELPLN